jgi:hypothetical protein
MVPDNAEVFRKVVERLYKMTAPQYRATPITEETEIYLDLGIFGDEIVELVWWLEREFAAKTNVNPFRYAPREGALRGMLRTLRRIMGFGTQYESLKVRDIVAVIEAKRWPDDPSPIAPISSMPQSGILVQSAGEGTGGAPRGEKLRIIKRA